MAVSLAHLPRYIILEPVSTVRLEMELAHPSCEIDVELQNPQPGRSFVLLIGKQGGPHLQRMRLSGRARILFDPKAPGAYVLMLANPQREPLVLRLRARNIVKTPRPSARPRRRTPSRTIARRQRPTARQARKGRGVRPFAEGAPAPRGRPRRSAAGGTDHDSPRPKD